MSDDAHTECERCGAVSAELQDYLEYAINVKSGLGKWLPALLCADCARLADSGHLTEERN
jgi:hypothetical protein